MKPLVFTRPAQVLTMAIGMCVFLTQEGDSRWRTG
jgi:hypothetical protein